VACAATAARAADAARLSRRRTAARADGPVRARRFDDGRAGAGTWVALNGVARPCTTETGMNDDGQRPSSAFLPPAAGVHRVRRRRRWWRARAKSRGAAARRHRLRAQPPARNYRLTLRARRPRWRRFRCAVAEREALRFVEEHRDWPSAPAHASGQAARGRVWTVGTHDCGRGEMTEVRIAAVGERPRCASRRMCFAWPRLAAIAADAEAHFARRQRWSCRAHLGTRGGHRRGGENR